MSSVDAFHTGLTNLKSAIEACLVDEGARIGHRSITHSKLGGVAMDLWIDVVPLNGPKASVQFLAKEIAACANGIEPEVKAKIDLYSQSFRRHLDSPDRKIRAARSEGA
jgi:hypothetical protein